MDEYLSFSVRAPTLKTYKAMRLQETKILYTILPSDCYTVYQYFVEKIEKTKIYLPNGERSRCLKLPGHILEERRHV